MKRSNYALACSILWCTFALGCNEVFDINVGETLPNGAAGGNGGAGGGNGGAGSGSGGAGGGNGGDGGGCVPQPEICGNGIDEDCNGVTDDIPPLTIVKPIAGDTPGGSVTFQWSGGAKPYFVEIAFDPNFQKPWTNPDGTPKIFETNDQSIAIDGLNGGNVYWRVRSKGCNTDTYVDGGKLHLTCKPVLLTENPTSNSYQPSIARNPSNGEYGVVFVQIESGTTYLDFLRTDRLGNVVFHPVHLPVPQTLTGDVHPDLAYIPNVNRWAVTYLVEVSEASKKAHVLLLDDNGSSVGAQPLGYGAGSETQSVSYSPITDQILTLTDHFVGVAEPYLERFDASLTKIGSVIDIGESNMSNCNGQFGTMTQMPGLEEGKDSAFMAFDYYESALNNSLHHLFIQRATFPSANGVLTWPKGTTVDCYNGKMLVSGLEGQVEVDVSYLPASAWNPGEHNIGLVYARRNELLPKDTLTDAYFALVDPEMGVLLSALKPLHSGAEKFEFPEMPEIAWDGEEFLVLWNDGRDDNKSRHIRMSKFTAKGELVGSGDQELKLEGKDNAIPGWSGKSLVGHDNIHTLVGQRWEESSSTTNVWMCIEPPYVSAP
jgi:hypothetical protein